MLNFNFQLVSVGWETDLSRFDGNSEDRFSRVAAHMCWCPVKVQVVMCAHQRL